jgi:cell division septal protein FtsQ
MKQLSIVHSMAWIIGSALFTTGFGHLSIKHYQHSHWRYRTDPNYFISRVVQTGPQKEALTTEYLTELIGISADRPTPSIDFHKQEAERRLLNSPVIAAAEVKLLESDTIYINYAVRQPIAWLYDFENAAIDENGVVFPVFPFFTSKKLPEIYLGISDIQWGKEVQDPRVKLALRMLKELQQLFPVVRIDLSKSEMKTLGEREIVVITHDQDFSRILRLSVNNYTQALGDYLQLRSRLPQTSQIIDLRIPQLAFIEEGKASP